MLAKGRNYWSTFPDSKKVVAISRREMIGNSVFSVADMFQIDTEADYTARVVAEENDNGTNTLKLDCTAKTEDAPYHRIEYWVEKNTSFPVRAKFYGTSGKHLKTLFVETRKKLAGRLRPEVVRMEDATVKGKTSWWKTKEMRSASIPDNVFTIEYLQNSR
jgi:outer membrane lipoprotein-sorting protein